MKIDNIKLHKFFVEKGITHLHHANSIASSVSFIEAGGLLSRGDIEKNGLYQTEQKSDDEDKQFDVWDDVFVDTVDLHGLFPRQNLYGPLLFKFNINFLLDDDIDIWITKSNPMYWKVNQSESDKYFQGIDDLKANWDEFETQRKMITIRKPGKPVLFTSLEEIKLDNPKVTIHGKTVVFTEAKKLLDESTKDKAQLRALIDIRECGHCYCEKNYLNSVGAEQLARLFLPKDHEHFPD